MISCDKLCCDQRVNGDPQVENPSLKNISTTTRVVFAPWEHISVIFGLADAHSVFWSDLGGVWCSYVQNDLDLARNYVPNSSKFKKLCSKE